MAGGCGERLHVVDKLAGVVSVGRRMMDGDGDRRSVSGPCAKYLPKVMMGGRKGGSVACTWAMPVKLSHGSADMGQQLAGLPGLARTPLISL